MKKEHYIDTISDKLSQIYGIGKSKETILDFAKYVELKQSGEIHDVGNYNIMIKCPENYLDTNKIIEIIYKILKHYKVACSTSYYKLKRADFRRDYEKIKEDMIVVSKEIECNNPSMQEILKEYIQNSPNKIFVIVHSIETEISKGSYTEMDIGLEELFSWHIEITRELTLEEKKEHITSKLKKNNVQVSKKCNFVNELSKVDIQQIDKELLYVLVKCKANHIDLITNDFLQLIHREQYILDEIIEQKTAMQELDAMIGLDDIKRQIKQIVNYVKVNKSRGKMPMLHMVFSGPSGCGKNEVARLVGRIFKEQNILSQGQFVEVSRADLVAGYVGQTALKTQDVINKAKGGVLFIDERLCIKPKKQWQRLWLRVY